MSDPRSITDGETSLPRRGLVDDELRPGEHHVEVSWSAMPGERGGPNQLGPYGLEGIVARGGMGSVWRGRNRLTGELRAIKVLRADFATNPDFLARFAREATFAASLHHPNVVETYDPGVDGTTAYIPMELLSGPTLDQRIRSRRSPLDEVVWILSGLCAALQVVHDRGWVHRDVKPSNVILTDPDRQDVPKLIDFGTARMAGLPGETRHGLVVGSPCYMAPEQAHGSTELDGRADQYAVGVLAYEMLTGRRPHVGGAQQVLLQLLAGQAPDPIRAVDSTIPASVARLVTRALATRPEDRFGSMTELADALWWAKEDAKLRPTTPPPGRSARSI